MKDLEILNPIKELTIGNEKVNIKELSFPKAMEFLKKLAVQAGQFTVDGKLSVTPDKLADLITGTHELSEWLVLESTGKDANWLKERTFSEGLDVVEASLSMNLRPDFFAKLKRIGARFMGANPAALPQPSISSSGKDTPAQT